jgi:hypothetical protein
MKSLLYTGLLLLQGLAYAQTTPEEVLNLRNDKEVIIRAFSQKEQRRIQRQYSQEMIGQTTQAFYAAVFEYQALSHKRCEFNFLDILKAKLSEAELDAGPATLPELFKVLRTHHAIDDILYQLLSSVNADYAELGKIDPEKKPRPRLLPRRGTKMAASELASLYEDFAVWPDEIHACVYNSYIYLKKQLEDPKHLARLNRQALKEELITQETFNKLEYLRTQSDINKRVIWLNDYFQIIFHAKNKLQPLSYVYRPVNLENENDFSSRRIRRFSKITRRELLYRKYNETQIILLAQVLQKAARRMGVDPDTESKGTFITSEYSVLQPDGQRRNYVERFELDPQSQFNLARRLLRKDIIELQMMDLFNGLKISYADVVMAAFETGYVSLEDLEYVVQYDDLWNPEKSKFERLSGFVFRLGGYGVFLLPTPWNITASLALGIVEGIVDNKTKSGAHNDNPATFIE